MRTKKNSAWRWAEPLIHDTLIEIYSAALGSGDDTVKIARFHAKIWGETLDGKNDQPAVLALIELLKARGHDRKLVNHATAAVAVELADLVRRRFRTSDRQFWPYREALVSATAGLAKAG